MTRARRDQTGLTLVELMIAVVIFGIVMTAALAMGFSMMNGYRDHRAMVLVERSARVSLDIISQAARGSIPGVPEGNIIDLVGCSDNLVGLYVENSETAPDAITLVYASGGVLSAIRNGTYGKTSTNLYVLDPAQFGITDANFTAGDYAVISNVTSTYDPSVGPVGALVQISDVQPDGSEFLLKTANANAQCPGSKAVSSSWPSGNFGEGSLVVRAKLARFFIEDDAAVGNTPTLMMDPDGEGSREAEPMAEGVEDMQIAVGVDVDADGDVEENGAAANDDEWFYNVAGDADPPPGILPRALRITLVARSTREQSNKATYVRPAVEDRDVGTTPDPYRRRVLSTTIEIRNHRDSE